MNIYEVNRILASKNKSRLIAHFWNCKCISHDVNNLVKKMEINQSNLSKHVSTLLREKILDVKQEGKERYYKINQDWKKQWQKVVDPQINLDVNNVFQCSCINNGGKCEI